MEQLEQYPDLVRLRRTLKRSEGMFSLFFAECNLPLIRQQLIASLQEDFRLCVIDLAALDQSSLAIDQVLHHALQQQPDAEVLCVFGLEHLLPVLKRDELLDTVRQMNWRRNQYRDLARPLVLWLPSFALRLLSEQAPDFYDWYSGVYRFAAVVDDQQAALQQFQQDFTSPTGVPAYQRQAALEIRQQVQQIKGLLAESHRPQDQAYLTNQLATLLQSQGDYVTAQAYLQQSLKICEEIGDRVGMGVTLSNLSQIYDAQGDYATALAYLQKSLKIAEEIGDQGGMGATLNNLSQIYDAQGDYTTAQAYLQQSLKIREEIGDRAGMGTTLNNLAKTAHAQGDYMTALAYLQQSLEITEEIGDRAGMGRALFNLGMLSMRQHAIEPALRYFAQAKQIALSTQAFELLTALQNLEKQLELPADWSEKWLQTDQ